MWYDGFGWWMAIGMLSVVIFWGAIIALVVWVVIKMTEPRGPGPVRGQSALDIARERYARGEITREQFEQLKKDLS